MKKRKGENGVDYAYLTAPFYITSTTSGQVAFVMHPEVTITVRPVA